MQHSTRRSRLPSTPRTLAVLTVAALVWAAGATSPAQDKDPAPPKFRGTAVLPGVPGIGAGFSDDGQAGTVIFDSLVTDAGGGRSGRDVGTTTLTVKCALNAGDKPVRIRQFVRGFVFATPKSSVALVYHAAGKTTVVDVVKAKASEADRRAAKPGVWKAAGDRQKMLSDDRQKMLSEGFEYIHEAEIVVPAKGAYTVTFHIQAERPAGDPAHDALVTVDSLDFVIVK